MAGKIKIKGNFIVAAACILLSGIFITAGICQCKNGSSFLHNLALKAEGEGFSGKWLNNTLGKGDDLDNTDNVSFAAWTELKGEQVSAKDGTRQCSTDVCAVYGESGCVLPFGRNLPVADSQMIYMAFAGGWQYFAFSTMKDKNQVESNSFIFEILGVISLKKTIFG